MPTPLALTSHWHYSVENLSTSSLEFYQSLEMALKAKEAEGLQTERVEWNEGGLLSAKRIYLRVSYRRFVFDICAAPFGKDFFFSWWLGKKMPNLAALGCGIILGVPIALVLFVAMGGVTGLVFFFFALIIGTFVLLGSLTEEIREAVGDLPVIGSLYTRLFNPVTYYAEDTRKMFEETVHRVMLDVISGVLVISKMSPLTDAEKLIERSPRQ